MVIQNFLVVRTVMEEAVKLWPKFLNEHKVALDGRTGLYLVGTDLSYKNTIGMEIGKLAPEKLIEKMGFAFEKLTRLLKDSESTHLTSFATQDYAKKQFGGAIKTNTIVLSASALPPEYDHAFVMRVLRETGNCSRMMYDCIQRELKQFKNFGK